MEAKVRGRWTKEKSMSIYDDDVDGDVGADAMAAMAMAATMAKESDGLGHRMKGYGAKWGGF